MTVVPLDPPKSKMFEKTVLEPKEDIEEKLAANFASVEAKISGLSEREIHDRLIAEVSLSPTAHDEVANGLLYAILTDPTGAPKFFQNLLFAVKDGFKAVVTTMNVILFDSWGKLTESSRQQFLWLTKSLIQNSVVGIENICIPLLRQIAGGDVSPKNLWLAESVLDILVENRVWVDKTPMLIPYIVYTYLRLLVDHFGPQFSSLRAKEVKIVESLLREKFLECMAIGRDLVRLLIMVTKIPEFEKFWQDLLTNPASLAPSFQGVLQLMQTRTAKRFVLSRLTPDMERKIYFILNDVKFGTHRRYQEWFMKQYLSTPESQSLRADIIRYICCVIHPSNEILASDITPRWALVGWLITSCTGPVFTSYARLALFFDWMFYDAEKGDNIMNIEPGFLVMHHSLRTCLPVTTMLLDFLCRLATEFFPSAHRQVRDGIATSLRQIVEKRVVPSLQPLFDHPKFEKELRILLQERFPEFCSAVPEISQSVTISSPSSSSGLSTPEVVEVPDDTGVKEIDYDSGMDGGAQFSDEENMGEPKDNIEEDKVAAVSASPVSNRLASLGENSTIIDYQTALQQLPENFRAGIEAVRVAIGDTEKSDAIQQFLSILLDDDEFDEDQASFLADCFCHIFQSQFEERIFPSDPTDDNCEESIAKPLFMVMRNLVFTPDEDQARTPLILLLSQIYNKQARLGYFMLYFMKASDGMGEKMNAYRDVCKQSERESVEECLVHDMGLCRDDDLDLFMYLIPSVYSKLANVAVPSADLMHTVVETIDGRQLQKLVEDIILENFVMFRKDSFNQIMTASLGWETIEQYFFWQLVMAHDVKLDWIQSIIPKLEYPGHAEAISVITIMMKRTEAVPTSPLIRAILMRDPHVKDDLFAVSALKILYDVDSERFSELLTTAINKAATLEGSTGKAKKQTKEPNLDQVLGHLDCFRQRCTKNSQASTQAFFMKDSIQSCLHEAQRHCSQQLKTRYADLFAIMDVLDSVRGNRTLRRGRKVAQHGNSSDKQDDSSDEETKTKPPRKKKKVVDSDSE